MESLTEIGKYGFKFNPTVPSVADLAGLKLNCNFAGSYGSISALQLSPIFSGINLKRLYLGNFLFDFSAGNVVDCMYGNFVGGQIDGSATSVYGVYVDSVMGGGQVTNAWGGYFKTPVIGGNRCALYADDLKVGSGVVIDHAGNTTVAGLRSSSLTSGDCTVANLSGKNGTFENITSGSISSNQGSFTGIKVGDLVIDNTSICSSSLTLQKIFSINENSARLTGKLTVDSLDCDSSGKFHSLILENLNCCNIIANGDSAFRWLTAKEAGLEELKVSGSSKFGSGTFTSLAVSGESVLSGLTSLNLSTGSLVVNGPASFGGVVQFPIKSGLVCVDSTGQIGLDSSSFDVAFRSLRLAGPLDIKSGGTGYGSWAPGDLFAGGAKFPIGPEGYVLTSVSGAVVWKSCPGNVLSVSGTAGHIICDSSVGDVVLRLPQAIGTDANVSFGSLKLSGSLDMAGDLKMGGHAQFNNIDAAQINLSSGLNVTGLSKLGDLECNNIRSSSLVNCAGINSSGPIMIGSANVALFSVAASADINCVASLASSINSDSVNSFGLALSNSINVARDGLIAGLYLNNSVSAKVGLGNVHGLYIDSGKFDCLSIGTNYGAYIKRPSASSNSVALFADNLVVADGVELGGVVRIKAGFAGLCCIMSDGLLSNNTSQVSALFASVTSSSPIGTASGGTGFASWASGEMPVGSTDGSIQKIVPGAAGQILMSNGPNCSPSWRYETLASTPLTGTPDMINIVTLADKILFSTPQPINCSSAPQFARLGLGIAPQDRYSLTVAGPSQMGLCYIDRLALGAYGGTDPTNAGYLVTSGAIGVGTNSPQYSLDVAGSGRIGVLGVGCPPNSTYSLSVNGGAGFYGSVDVTGKMSVASLETTGRILSEGGIIANTKALATNATDGYFYSTATMGIPVGAPTVQPGVVPMVYDLNNDTQYVFNEGWKNVGGAVVAYANHTRCAVDNTLSRLCVKQSCIIRGSSWFNGAKTMAGYFDTMVVQQPGDYSLSIGGQIKSAGNGTTHVKVTRAAAVIYDQTYVRSISSDGAFSNEHILLDMRVGDVVVMEACEKNNASPLSGITDAAAYGGGQLIMKLI